MNHESENLKLFLDGLLFRYHRKKHLDTDPIGIVHRYKDPNDQEVVSIVAALLSYGNVKQIRKSLESWISVMTETSENPRDWLRTRHSAIIQKKLGSWKHRFHTYEDLIQLLDCIEISRKEFGSVGAQWHKIQDQAIRENSEICDPRQRGRWVGRSLDLLLEEWKRHQRAPSPYFFYFMTQPKNGSCCKRWMMLLRWMIRKDEVDLGLWEKKSGLGSEHLIVPVDTHIARQSRLLNLAHRKSTDWWTALEITEELAKFYPKDPVSVDFALTRLGMFQKSLNLEIS